MTDTTLFAQPDAKEWEPTPDGNRRRVILHTDELMMVEFAFEKGGIGALHSHPHVKALEAGRLVDNFTPQRRDFL